MNRNDNLASHANYVKSGVIARVLTVALGLWLVISAFAWPHTSSHEANACIVGVLTAAFGLVALIVLPKFRFLDALLAIWLFVSPFAIATISTATVWNNVFAAILIFALSLVPSAVPSPYGYGTVRPSMIS